MFTRKNFTTFQGNCEKFKCQKMDIPIYTTRKVYKLSEISTFPN